MHAVRVLRYKTCPHRTNPGSATRHPTRGASVSGSVTMQRWIAVGSGPREHLRPALLDLPAEAAL